MKKDNLKDFRDKRVKKNIELIKKAIFHIQKYNGKITMSSVAKVTKEIASIEFNGKGLTLSAISKNDYYRNLINKAELESKNINIQKNNPLSEGDARLMLHGLRVENAILKDELKILKSKLKVKNLDVSTKEDRERIIDENEFVAINTIKSLIFTLQEEELAVIDINTSDLLLARFGTLLLKGELVKRFIGDINE